MSSLTTSACSCNPVLIVSDFLNGKFEENETIVCAAGRMLVLQTHCRQDHRPPTVGLKRNSMTEFTVTVDWNVNMQ